MNVHEHIFQSDWEKCLFLFAQVPINYRFWAGSQDVVVYARKHNLTNDYVIGATIQPQSNYAGNTPTSWNATITLAGATLVFEVRRQGSVYALRTSTSGQPVSFVQLDGWHEDAHPSFWNTGFHPEAELLYYHISVYMR